MNFCAFFIISTINIHVYIQNSLTERTEHNTNSSSGNRDFSQTLGVTVPFDVCNALLFWYARFFFGDAHCRRF